MGPRGNELWITDGTSAGTRLIVDLLPGGSSSNVHSFHEYAGALYFEARDDTSKYHIFSTDGTQSGTQRVVEGSAGIPTILGAVTGRLLFIKRESNSSPDHHLYETDGTAAGTKVVVASISERAGQPFLIQDDTLLFTFSGLPGLWITDGTAAGTRKLADVTPTPNPMVVSSVVYFFGTPAETVDTELWRTDGTEAGTARVDDLFPGGIGCQPKGNDLHRRSRLLRGGGSRARCRTLDDRGHRCHRVATRIPARARRRCLG